MQKRSSFPLPPAHAPFTWNHHHLASITIQSLLLHLHPRLTSLRSLFISIVSETIWDLSIPSLGSCNFIPILQYALCEDDGLCAPWALLRFKVWFLSLFLSIFVYKSVSYPDLTSFFASSAGSISNALQSASPASFVISKYHQVFPKYFHALTFSGGT